MNRRRRLRLWAHFTGITIVLAIPVLGVYLYLADRIEQYEQARYQTTIDNQINVWQEQLADFKWDAAADTKDDTLHLGHQDEAELLAQTLVWYVNPARHRLAEGIAVINPDGSLRLSKQAAVIDHTGNPLTPEQLADIKRKTPWVDSPWLDDYSFVVKAFVQDGDRDFYVSPFIKAPGRTVLVMASAKRDGQGRLEAAVMLQMSTARIFTGLLKAGSKGHSIWLMDQSGKVGYANNSLALFSAKEMAAAGTLQELVKQGGKAVALGLLGAGGRRWQVLGGKRCLLTYRTQGSDMVIGVVATEQAMVRAGRVVLRTAGSISLLAILMLAVGGAIYTFLSLSREGRMVEMATLRRYAGTISHRVRNDLATAQGQLELISCGLVTDPAKIKGALSGPVDRALVDIQATLSRLESLSRGEVDISYEGQAGQDTMFQVGDNHKEESSS